MIKKIRSKDLEKLIEDVYNEIISLSSDNLIVSPKKGKVSSEPPKLEIRIDTIRISIKKVGYFASSEIASDFADALQKTIKENTHNSVFPGSCSIRSQENGLFVVENISLPHEYEIVDLIL